MLGQILFQPRENSSMFLLIQYVGNNDT